MDNRPIGMLDSGFGGLFVLKTVKEYLPHESFVFYGDNGNAPYGTKSREEIILLVKQGVEVLLQYNIKCLLIACNTATSATIDELRQTMSFPVVSMEPAIKLASDKSNGQGKILMMATPATCQMDRYQELKTRIDKRHQVQDILCYGLVEAIENNILENESFEPILQGLLSQYDGEEIAGIVLGCTHFPYIGPEIQAYAQEHFRGSCTLYDGSNGTAQHLQRVLQQNQLVASECAKQHIELLTTGKQANVLPMMRKILAMT